MKMKKLAAALLAAAVLATTVAPTATPVFAATTAETTATDATPEQEVTVKKPAKATVAAKNDSVKDNHQESCRSSRIRSTVFYIQEIYKEDYKV